MTTVDALELINQQPADPIRNGRYYLPDPAGKPTYWTRATTLAKVVEDQENLTKWRIRTAAVGIATTPSLSAALIAATGDKAEQDRICDQAKTAAKGDEARDLGTALHRIVERADLGELDDPPEPWAGDLRAYRAKLAACGLTVHPDWVETVLVNVPYQCAGKVDRLLVDHEGRLVVADLKTGSYLSWLSFAAQFAIYATATHRWNPDTDQLEPLPDIRQDHALCIHLPAGRGQCDIYPLSVGVGVDAVAMALEVRRLRALGRRTAHIMADTWQPPTTPEPAVDEGPGAWLDRKRIAEDIARWKASHVDAARDLARQWPAGVPTLRQADAHTVDQLTAIREVMNKVAATHQLPF